jgi:hypothetical protein
MPITGASMARSMASKSSLGKRRSTLLRLMIRTS